MNRLGFWFFCCFVSFNSLNAQPRSGAGSYVWDPYNRIQPRQELEPRYQLFVGQIPNFWITQQIVDMFFRSTGIEVQVTGRIADGYAFVITRTQEQRDRLLQLSRRLLAEAHGFWSLTGEQHQNIFVDTALQDARQRRGLPRLPIVIEMPRNPEMQTLPRTQ